MRGVRLSVLVGISLTLIVGLYWFKSWQEQKNGPVSEIFVDTDAVPRASSPDGSESPSWTNQDRLDYIRGRRKRAGLEGDSCGNRDFEDLDAINVQVKPISPVPTESVGELRYRGGLVLSSNDPRFGGLSALDTYAETPKGAYKAVAVTDAGLFLQFTILEDQTSALAGIENLTGMQLRGANGRQLEGKHQADAEGIAFIGHQIAISFERDHRIGYMTVNACGKNARLVFPGTLKGLGQIPTNKGIEATAIRRGDGKIELFLGLEDTKNGSSKLARAPFMEDVEYSGAKLSMPDEFGLTGMDILSGVGLLNKSRPDRIYFLERAYDRRSGNRIRIVARELVDFDKWGSDLDLLPEGRILAELSSENFPVDNFEGISAIQQSEDTVRLYLVSDNNFSERQRTLLVAFDYTIPAE